MTADLLGPDHKSGRQLMRTAVRLLARGEPVTMGELAAAAGVDVVDLIDAPAGPDIEYDDEHRIIGWGLTLVPTPHKFVVDDHRLYTWCAADTLMFPAIIGRRAQIESRCPTTDTVIRLRVDPDGRWDPFFTEYMTLADVYRCPSQHFDFHARQLALS
jgi:Alkylmercury lyase/Helix-turn-helix domain of alkylmercury lyase